MLHEHKAEISARWCEMLTDRGLNDRVLYNDVPERVQGSEIEQTLYVYIDELGPKTEQHSSFSFSKESSAKSVEDSMDFSIES